MIYSILAVMLVLVVVIMAAPISLGYDSTENWFRVKWLGLTITRRPTAKKLERAPKKLPKKWQIRGLALMRRLWQVRDLLLELTRRLGQFGFDLFQASSFRDSEATVSLPDPMWNGVLCGMLTNIHLKDLNLSVNFENRNYARIWMTVYPYRVVPKLLVLLLRLPYIRMVRFAWDLKKSRQTI